jgi:ketosteroid isomerase-like protein
MATADEWIDKAAIAELITRYAALNDAGDWPAVAALYVEDGRMSRPSAPDDFIAGREAILAAFQSRPRRAARHIVANILVTLAERDRASATSNILLFAGTASSTPGELPLQAAAPPWVGTYHDKLARTPQGWRFVERRGSLDFRPPT